MTGVKRVEPQLVAALVLEPDRGSRGLNPTVRTTRRGTMTNGEEVRQGRGGSGQVRPVLVGHDSSLCWLRASSSMVASKGGGGSSEERRVASGRAAVRGGG